MAVYKEKEYRQTKFSAQVLREIRSQVDKLALEKGEELRIRRATIRDKQAVITGFDTDDEFFAAYRDEFESARYGVGYYKVDLRNR